MQTATIELTKQKWLTQLDQSYRRYKRAGWEFVFLLRDGIDALGTNEHVRANLYQDASNQTGLSVHTLQNYVSAARKPYASVAHEYDLEIGHLDAVLGLEDEKAEDILKRAAEQSMTVAQTRKEAWPHKSNPDVGKQIADAADRFLSSEPPYNDDATYEQQAEAYDETEFVYIPRDPYAAARKLRATFSESDIATIVAELVSDIY